MIHFPFTTTLKIKLLLLSKVPSISFRKRLQTSTLLTHLGRRLKYTENSKRKDRKLKCKDQKFNKEDIFLKNYSNYGKVKLYCQFVSKIIKLSRQTKTCCTI